MRGGVTNLVLAGVGGQGSVLATRIVAGAAHRAGYEVATSEVHGMAQRGGAVLTTVRYGLRVLAPAVPEGEADVLVAFERLEALRHLALLRPTGTLLLSDHRVPPTVPSLRLAPYPSLPPGPADHPGPILVVPAPRIASELGSLKLAGTVLLGALSGLLDIPSAAWHASIIDVVPPGTGPANLEAFQRGAAWLERTAEATGTAGC